MVATAAPMPSAPAPDRPADTPAGPLGDALDEARRALAESHLSPPLEFTFRWRGRRVLVRVLEHDKRAVLRLAADLGTVPYSAENADQRSWHHELCQTTEALGLGRFAKTPGQHLVHCAELELAQPLTAPAIVAAIARLLLQSLPYYALARN